MTEEKIAELWRLKEECERLALEDCGGTPSNGWLSANAELKQALRDSFHELLAAAKRSLELEALRRKVADWQYDLAKSMGSHGSTLHQRMFNLHVERCEKVRELEAENAELRQHTEALREIDWEFVLAPHNPEDASIRELIRIFGVTRVQSGEMEGCAAWWAAKARGLETENAELRRKLEEAEDHIFEQRQDSARLNWIERFRGDLHWGGYLESRRSVNPRAVRAGWQDSAGDIGEMNTCRATVREAIDDAISATACTGVGSTRAREEGGE